MRYYIVGNPMTIRDHSSESTRLLGTVLTGYNFNQTAQYRALTREMILDEAFENNKITQVFTDYDTAATHAKSLGLKSGFPKNANMGKSAPVLTIETDEAACVGKLLSASTITIIRAEFPGEPCAVEFSSNRNACSIV
jgi:hypothetical protein